MPYFENLCDQLDAAVFSGDSLEDPKNRTLFAEHLDRWQRRVAEMSKLPDEAVLIAEFVRRTGASWSAAADYLTSANFDLEAAVSTWLANQPET